MKKLCSIACICLALLFTGCVSARHKTPKQFSCNLSDQSATPYSIKKHAIQRQKGLPFFPDKDVRSFFDWESNIEINESEMYLAEASTGQNFLKPYPGQFMLTSNESHSRSGQESFLVDQEGEHIFNRDYPLYADLNFNSYPYFKPFNADGDFSVVDENDRHLFKFTQKSSEPTDFSEFENEFKDIRIDTQGKGVYDPLMGFNRLMYRFNDRLYFWVLKPVSKGYGKVVPEELRVAFNRFFKNLSFPVRFANNALQGKFKRTGVETIRFVMNSTLGILGLSDPAYALLNLQAYDEDFGQTLGHYGAGDGFPLVLPFLGPSNLRDAVGIIPDLFLYPIAFLDPENRNRINRIFLGVKIWEVVNRTSLRIGFYENLKRDALDPYTLMRDSYKQNRDAEIKE